VGTTNAEADRAERIDHGIRTWCRSYQVAFDGKTRTAMCVLWNDHDGEHDFRGADEAHAIRGTTPSVRPPPDRRCVATKRETWNLPGVGKKRAVFRCAYDADHSGYHLYPVLPEKDPMLT
jgi:hypothetical protein